MKLFINLILHTLIEMIIEAGKTFLQSQREVGHESCLTGVGKIS